MKAQSFNCHILKTSTCQQLLFTIIENNGIGDSLDLVVVGANYGKGKRVGLYGVFMMASYDPDYDTYETVCLVGTGFSEENLKIFNDQFKPMEINDKPKNVLI